MTRDYIELAINGQVRRVTGAEAFLSLADYLRGCQHMIGIKIVCSEGDCGACTVLVTRVSAAYRPLDACITWMFQLDHASVITVEGLAENQTPTTTHLHPIQQAMVNGHGSQCGFCTPGFVMAMAGLADEAQRAGAVRLDADTLRTGLTGNLCRCTGYTQIITAAQQVDPRALTALAQRYPLPPWTSSPSQVHVRADAHQEVFIPTTLADACTFLAANPNAKIVSGATDVGVALNKGLYALGQVLYLGRIAEMQSVRVADNQLHIGAATNWASVEAVVAKALPQFAHILALFGAPQIRTAGTIGGNVINASPIADSLPLLMVTDARLRLVSATGQRWVEIKRFYLGYKKMDLHPGELLAEVQLTLPAQNQELRLYKVSRRLDLDISTFTAGILLTMEGPRITSARIAYGGVAPVVLRLPRTEAFLAGKTMTAALMHDAGAFARQEITPITDVRASADYRLALAQTILSKAYFDIMPAPATAHAV